MVYLGLEDNLRADRATSDSFNRFVLKISNLSSLRFARPREYRSDSVASSCPEAPFGGILMDKGLLLRSHMSSGHRLHPSFVSLLLLLVFVSGAPFALSGDKKPTKDTKGARQTK